MIFHRSTSLLLSVVIFFQAIAPALAVPPDSIDTLERHSLRLRSTLSVPSGLSFKAQQGKTAAGILLYGMHEGKIHILLGQRNDHPEHWCNLGGGSEEAEGEEVSLFHTAARETEEESNGLYCPHPYLVKNQPYIDMYDGSLLYRMYWQKVQYLDKEILNARLNGATTSGRELKEFLWVKSKRILEAVKTQKPLVRIDEERSIELYPELFRTLSTPSGKAFLESLVTHKRIKRFSKEVRPLVNQLYWVGDNLPSDDLEPMPSQSWPTVDVRLSRRDHLVRQLQHWQEKLTEAQASKGKKHNKARKVQHAHNVVKELQSELDKHPNSWNPLAKSSDKTTFARAVAAHVAMLIEFKRHFSKMRSLALASEKPEPVESYTDMSLRIILGPDYKTYKDFPEAQDPQDKADTLNIETFLDRYYRPDEAKEGKREVSILPSDISFIKSLLKKSRQNGLQPIFYNATSESLYGLFMFFTHLREYIMAMPLKGLAALRGTDIYFKDVETMSDVLSEYGYHDYSNGGASHDERKNSVLCGNFTALAGLKTTRTSSSSLEYAMNDHAVAPPDLGSAIQEALALSGFNNPTSKYFDSLFQQFVSHLHREYANSVMLAIRMTPELLEDHTYAAFGGGSPFTQEVKTDDKPEKRIVTPSQVFEGLKAEAERQKDSPEPFEKDIERKRHLIPEVRILLSPRVMFTEGVHVKPTPRFPMDKESKEEFKDLSHVTCMAMIGDWLSEENCILEGSFHQYPVAKKLYRAIHLGLTGRPVKEKISFEGFFYLVRNGYYEAVKEYLANYPTLVKETAYSSERMIIAALKSNSRPMLQLIFEDLKGVLQVDLLDEQIAKFARVAQDSGWGQSAYFLLEYLVKNSKTIPERFYPTFCQLFQLFQPKSLFGIPNNDDLMNRLELIPRFVLPSAPEWFKDKIKHMVINQMPLEMSEFVCNGILFPRKVTSPLDMLSTLQNDLSSTAWRRDSLYALKYQRLFISFLKQEEQENLLLHQEITGDPLIFGLARWKVPLCKDLMTYLQEHPDVLTLKNKEGLTLLGAAQKAHLEGHSSENLTSLMLLYKGAKLDIKQESYPPFFELYGLNYEQDYSFELVYTQNREWAMKLAEATPGDLSELLETCPDSRLLERFRHKLDNLRLPKIIKARQYLENCPTWVGNLQTALQRKRQGGGLQLENAFNFDTIVDAAEGKGNFGFAAAMRAIQASQASQDVVEDQFPHMSPFHKDTPQLSLSTLLSHIPESIDSLQHLVEELQGADFLGSRIVEFFQSLPEYNEVREALENRKESVLQKRKSWVEGLRHLVQEGDKSKIYAYVQTMPYLLKDQIEEVKSLLEPYYMQQPKLKTDASNLMSFLYSYSDSNELEGYSKFWSERIKKAKNNPKEIQKFSQDAPASVLRKSLVLFLRKGRLSYLPELLKRAYSNSHDFAQEYEFRVDRYDVFPTIPSSYHHPFPYVLNGEDPVKMVECFLPFLDSKDAPKLLNNLTQDQFCAAVKKNKRSDVEALVNLVPWMFQWRENAKDFFLLSIKFLPKTALRQLLMKDLNLLKESETNQRYLPYFVYLMMDGQNESIVKEALHKDPSLLKIESLDGLGIEDFLTYYASPAIVKVVREFQKGVSK